MRIISGKRRGYKLTPPIGDGARPTTDRVKESLFNIIQTRLPLKTSWIYLPEAARSVSKRSAAAPNARYLSRAIAEPANLSIKI